MNPAISPTLDQQLIIYRQNRFLTMPITGMIVWAGIGIAGAILPPSQAVLVTYVGTGMIFYFALLVAKLLGEDLLGRQRKGNFFDRVFLATCGMSFLVYSVAIPFQLHDPSSVTLSVGVLSGLMWLPFSLMIGHWVGFFHSVVRTVLLVIAWYLFPTHRFTLLPAIIVAVYLVSIIALSHRWNALKPSSL